MIKIRKYERSEKEKGWGYGHIRIDDFKVIDKHFLIDAYMIAVPPGRTTIAFGGWSFKLGKRSINVPKITLIDFAHRSLSWQVWREVDL